MKYSWVHLGEARLFSGSNCRSFLKKKCQKDGKKLAFLESTSLRTSHGGGSSRPAAKWCWLDPRGQGVRPVESTWQVPKKCPIQPKCSWAGIFHRHQEVKPQKPACVCGVYVSVCVCIWLVMCTPAPVSHSTQAIELKPSWGKAYSRKAAALHGLQRYDESIAAYERALQLEPNSAQLQRALGCPGAKHGTDSCTVFHFWPVWGYCCVPSVWHPSGGHPMEGGLGHLFPVFLLQAAFDQEDGSWNIDER